MTHDPRLPTIEKIMNGSNPFELVTIPPFGAMERWRAEAMLIGTTGGIQSVYDAVRSDASAAAARADADEARTALIQHVCDKIAEFEKRFDALVARVQAAEDARRAAADAAREFEEEPLELPPDFDRPQDLPPAPIGDATPPPGGELHTVAPKEDPSEPPEPPLEVVADPKDHDDNIGDLPEELIDLPEPEPEPKGSVYPQPTAISLNKA
jgi:hypothetical protein